MLDLILSLGWGTFSFTREKAEKIVNVLISKGEMSREEARQTMELLLARGEKERNEAKKYVQQKAKKMLQRFNFATRDDLLALQAQINILETKIDHLSNKDAENS